MKRRFIAWVAAAAGMVMFPGIALAAPDLVCTGFSSGGTWHNVVVPPGASCTLDDTRVLGNVTVKTGADFQVNTNSGHDTTIAGDVTGNGCDSIDLESTGGTGRIAVGGNLTIVNCTSLSFSGGRGNSFSPPIPPMTLLIGGNVKCDNNPGGCVFDYAVMGGNLDCSGNFECTLQSDMVGGNVAINNNSGVGGKVDNTVVGGDVKCNGNAGGVVGTGNTIAGTASGDCSGL